MANPTTNFGWVMPTNTDLVTDLPADFNVFGQAVDTSMADLKGGTTGQILSKASATDMDFTWITNDVGDITAVTATSPLTGGGTSGAITVGIQDATTSVKGSVQLSDSTSTTSSVLAATPTAVKSAYDLATTANTAAGTAQTTANAAIPKSTVTTAGDVIYATGSSAITRLGIGSTGQVLTVAAGIPSWATPAGGGGKILQVIQGSSTTSTSTTSTSFVDTGLSASITPTLATSRILVIVSHASTAIDRTTGGYGNGGFCLKRGTTTIQDLSNNSIGMGDTASQIHLKTSISFSYVDSPATTASTTYKTQMRLDVGTLTTQNASSPSQMILLEIGA